MMSNIQLQAKFCLQKIALIGRVIEIQHMRKIVTSSVGKSEINSAATMCSSIGDDKCFSSSYFRDRLTSP